MSCFCKTLLKTFSAPWDTLKTLSNSFVTEILSFSIFFAIIIVNFKSCLLLLFSKSSENEESEEEKCRTSPTPIETSDDNHNVLVGPWLSVDKEMKSTEGGHRSGSPVKETTATLIVCPVSVLSTWTVSMVYLYFLCL